MVVYVNPTTEQTPCCNSCAAGELGFLDLPKIEMPDVDSSTVLNIALAGALAFVGYQAFFGSRAKSRRNELTKAKADYMKRSAEIRSQYPRF
jgi:hypothetical protein